MALIYYFILHASPHDQDGGEVGLPTPPPREGIGTNQAPMIKGPALSDKSPRQTMSKKSGKSLKEKRAAKHAKTAAKASSTEALFHDKKR